MMAEKVDIHQQNTLLTKYMLGRPTTPFFHLQKTETRHDGTQHTVSANSCSSQTPTLEQLPFNAAEREEQYSEQI